MILKTIDGREIDDSKFKGYGEFTRYVQENFDKNWGKGTEKKTFYEVMLSAVKSMNVYATITVEANTEEEAKRKAIKEARKSSFDWGEGIYEDIDNIEIDSIEETEEAE